MPEPLQSEPLDVVPEESSTEETVGDVVTPQGAAPEPVVLVLTEEALHRVDARKIVDMHAEEPAAYQVLVPEGTDRNVLAEVLDHLTLFEMRETLQALRPVDRTTARTEARESLETSVRLLEDEGARVSGEVVSGNPIPALADAAKRLGAREIVIVTSPHAVEDTFHTDWASRAREQLGLPVLHMYAGDWRLG